MSYYYIVIKMSLKEAGLGLLLGAALYAGSGSQVGCGKSDGTIDKTFGGSDYDEGEFISETSDDGFILTGSTQSYGAGRSDLWLLKLTNQGDIEWETIW